MEVIKKYWIGIAGVGAVLLVIVLAVIGVFDGEVTSKCKKVCKCLKNQNHPTHLYTHGVTDCVSECEKEFESSKNMADEKHAMEVLDREISAYCN